MSNYLGSEIITKIFELHNLGKTREGISQELGISRSTVIYYLSPKSREHVRERSRRRLLNPEIRARKTSNRRQHRVMTSINGVRRSYKVQKRPRPDHCEICNKEVSHLAWHHWNDNDLDLGLWVCPYPCHGFAEGIDAGLKVKDYLKSKGQANRGELR